MTQKQKILAAFEGGARIKCTDAFPVYGISPHSFTRIIKELRDDLYNISDIEIKPKNGGHCYKEYRLEGYSGVISGSVSPGATAKGGGVTLLGSEKEAVTGLTGGLNWKQLPDKCPWCASSYYVVGDCCNVCHKRRKDAG